MNARILIIENHSFMSSLLVQLFSKNYDVVCLNTAKEALKWLEGNQKPDLIISDILMPEMDGFEFLEQLGASTLFSAIPVIMLSGLNKSQDRIRCLELGARDYVVKPFNPTELMIKANRLLKEAQSYGY